MAYLGECFFDPAPTAGQRKELLDGKTVNGLRIGAIDYVSEVQFQLPYEGAKEMLLVDDVEDKMYLKGLFETMYDELPFPKTKKKK